VEEWENVVTSSCKYNVWEEEVKKSKAIKNYAYSLGVSARNVKEKDVVGSDLGIDGWAEMTLSASWGARGGNSSGGQGNILNNTGKGKEGKGKGKDKQGGNQGKEKKEKKEKKSGEGGEAADIKASERKSETSLRTLMSNDDGLGGRFNAMVSEVEADKTKFQWAQQLVQEVRAGEADFNTRVGDKGALCKELKDAFLKGSTRALKKSRGQKYLGELESLEKTFELYNTLRESTLSKFENAKCALSGIPISPQPEKKDKKAGSGGKKRKAAAAAEQISSA